ADALDIPLDMLGITVCSIGGTNFTPYVKLLGPRGLNIPHVILTDRDPMAVGEPLVRRRLINILDVLEGDVDHDDMDTDEVIARAGVYGCFVNEITLEPELFTGGLAEAMQSVIERELSLAQVTLDRIQAWVDDTDQLDIARLLKLIERIGKGRFAQALATSVSEDVCPDYIREALEHIRDAVA
ncbi:TOPRIM nucleotidyl transferase/hydrolase domain-containing protein, partial [Klebsiella pneumoniae]